MLDAYVWTTPNGFKALIALEELAIPYKLHWIDITKGEQKTPEFLAINPNHKIPAIVDGDTTVFESGAVAIYLAENTGKLLAAKGPARYTALEWVCFNISGPGPILGQLGYFTKFAPEKIPQAIDRFTQEADRLFGVLDKRLGESQFLAGEFSIADIINFTWPNSARDFLGIDFARWPNLTRWLDELKARPAFAKALALKP
jgi:GST-like protein